jgi:cytidyltransferase-like protein
MITIVLCTGGFDPLHSGHIAYFNEAKLLGDELWIGLNSDKWLTRKKGRPFMPFNERYEIIKNLKMVDHVLPFDDDEIGSSNNFIEKVLSLTGSDTKIIVANGGDRNISNIPEVIKYGDHPRIKFSWSIGGDNKKNSSSWILESWSKPAVERSWGSYKILDKNKKWQVKELSFDVGKSLSNQRHQYRSEHWHVVEGTIQMGIEPSGGSYTVFSKGPGDSIDIPANTWHKATNIGIVPAKIIEVWLGQNLTEDDIERRD